MEYNTHLIVNGITMNNEKHTYERKVQYFKESSTWNYIEYVDDKIISGGTLGEALLTDICNYGNYILTRQGWEGPESIAITDGDSKITLTENSKSKFDSKTGILNVESIECGKNGGEDYIKYYKYDMNTARPYSLGENNYKTEKYSCDDDLYCECSNS